jgi:hypothetical protein
MVQKIYSSRFGLTSIGLIGLIVFIGMIMNSGVLAKPLGYMHPNGSFNCNDSNQYYVDGIISDREVNIYNNSNGTVSYKGWIDIDYKLFGGCYYTCKMNIFPYQKYAKFVNDHINELYAIDGIIHLFCNSSLCFHVNMPCITFTIRDEL